MRSPQLSDERRVVPPPGTLCDDEIEAVYGHAYLLLQAGQADEAAIVLSRLAAAAPYSAPVWQALGAALHQLDAAPAAAVALTMAALLRGDDEPPSATLAVIEAAAHEVAATG